MWFIALISTERVGRSRVSNSLVAVGSWLHAPKTVLLGFQRAFQIRWGALRDQSRSSVEIQQKEVEKCAI
jgi:hypothetical protein